MTPCFTEPLHQRNARHIKANPVSGPHFKLISAINHLTRSMPMTHMWRQAVFASEADDAHVASPVYLVLNPQYDIGFRSGWLCRCRPL